MQKIYTYIYVYIYVFDVASLFLFLFLEIIYKLFTSPPHLRNVFFVYFSFLCGGHFGIYSSLFVSGDVLYACCRSLYNENLLNKTVEKGTQPKIDISNDEFVSRPQVVERIKEILQPHKNHSYYHLICGEHGTGKTTLARIASSLWKAINFASEKISITGQWLRKIKSDDTPKISECAKALKTFRHASEVYKAKHDKPMVIVYDNVSYLVHKNPKILDILQDDAKHSADDRKYIAVFVCSEGSVPQRMESRSAWSRAKTPVMEIGDLSKEESMEYLIKKRKIKEVDAKKLFDLVGGRIIELKTVADDFLKGQEFEVVKKQVLNKVEKTFRSAELLPNGLYYEVGKSIIGDLLNSNNKSNELSFLDFNKYFDKTEKLNEVLGSNIFSYHPEKNVVTFQSQSVKCYVHENADIFSVPGSHIKIIEVN
ncbi:unnamed protein product [Rhizophagus irregularis]|nr:unnamed protein product [Rhizophagus irregularis]